MRLTFRLGILAICLLAPSIAAADGSDWYLGYSAGWGRESDVPLYSKSPPFASEDPGVTSDSGTKGSIANSLQAGYWFDRSIGLQIGYTDFGRYSQTAHVVAGGGCQQCVPFHFTDSGSVKAAGESLAITLKYPFLEGQDLMGRAGVFWGRANYADTTPSLIHYPADTSSISPTLGIAVGSMISPHWEAIVGFDIYWDIGRYEYGKFTVRVLSLGVQYHF